MNENLRKVSLIFLRKEDEILLAMKKRGFGEGFLNGIGGKQDPGETIEQTAVRECQEEIDVTPKKLGKVAVINFFFPEKPEHDQQCHVYFCEEWDGEPKETDEMRPDWVKLSEIPYEKMWNDDIIWLPKVLSGEKIEADFTFDTRLRLIDYSIKPMETE